MSNYPVIHDGREPRVNLVIPAGAEPGYAAAPDGFSLRSVLVVLRRNAWLILAVAAVTAGVAWYRFSRQLPLYKASALVRLVDARSSVAGGFGGASPEFQYWQVDPLRSQLEVLKGRSVLGSIVDSLGLRITAVPPTRTSAVRTVLEVEAPEGVSARVGFVFAPDTLTAAGGGVSRSFGYGERVAIGDARFIVHRHPGFEEVEAVLTSREDAISSLMAGLQLQLRDGTDAVDVEYTANDPTFAREVVNASVAQFQKSSAQAAQEDSRRRRIFLEEQLRGTETLFREVQTALSNFRTRQQVFSSREQFAAQQEGLMSLDVRREELAADKGIYEAALAELRRPGAPRSDVLRSLVASPGMSSNPVVTQLYAQLVQHQSARDSLMAGGSTPDHPEVRRLTNVISATEDRLVDAVNSNVTAMNARIGALDALRGRGTAELQALPATEAEEVRLTQQVEAMSKLGDQLREELQRARIAEAVEAGQVQLIHAAPEAAIIGAPLSVKMAIALFFGLGLGVAAAMTRTHLDTTIRDRDEVERILRAPKLATIPRLVSGHAGIGMVRNLLRKNGAGSDRRNTLIGREQVGSWEAEAYRTLRTNLIFSQTIRALKRIVITSSVPGEGKTTTAGNLGVAFAQQGLRVLLVDCDLRKPALHTMFEIRSDPGFTQLALGFAPQDECIRTTEIKNLFVLPAGVIPPNPAELLGGAGALALLERVSTEFDIVLLDTSPVMAASDAAILASHSDGVVLVVRAGFADRNAVQLAAQQLATVGARIIGAVFNDADSRAWPYDRSYHYKAYHTDA